jgi:hypothetical protein
MGRGKAPALPRCHSARQTKTLTEQGKSGLKASPRAQRPRLDARHTCPNPSRSLGQEASRAQVHVCPQIASLSRP